MAGDDWRLGAGPSGTAPGVQCDGRPAAGRGPLELAGVRTDTETLAMTLFHGLVSIGQWAQQHPQVVLGTFLGVPLLAGAVHVLTGGRQRRRETHGSARWGTYGEVKRSGLSRTQGVVV